MAEQLTSNDCRGCKGSGWIDTGTPGERIPCDCRCGTQYLERYSCKLPPDHIGQHEDDNVHWYGELSNDA